MNQLNPDPQGGESNMKCIVCGDLIEKNSAGRWVHQFLPMRAHLALPEIMTDAMLDFNEGVEAAARWVDDNLSDSSHLAKALRGLKYPSHLDMAAAGIAYPAPTPLIANETEQPEGATTQPTPASICVDPNCATCAEGRRIDAEHEAHYGAKPQPTLAELLRDVRAATDEELVAQGQNLAKNYKPGPRQATPFMPLPSAGSKPQEEGGMEPKMNVRCANSFCDHYEDEHADGFGGCNVVFDDPFQPKPSPMHCICSKFADPRQLADGGGLQGWESLSLAAQRAGGDKWTYDGQMFILAADGQIVAEPRGFGRGMDINIAEFISAASPENILKLLAAYASSQEALRVAREGIREITAVAMEANNDCRRQGGECDELRERMQRAADQLKPWLRTDCGCAVTEAIKLLSPEGSSR